jgi:BNR repeat protein
MRAYTIPCLLMLLGLEQTCPAQSGARIELAEFRVEPAEVRLGDSFVIHARAVATGVELGSFILRTADEVDKDDTIPGFPLYSSGKYYMAENGRFFLMDNGKLDENPEDGAVAIRIETRGWTEGVRTLALFASRRPFQGQFIVARHDFAVVVEGDRVVVEDLGPAVAGGSRAINKFDVRPTMIDPGVPVTVSLDVRPGAVRQLELTNPYYIAPQDTLPGFRYVDDKKRSFYESPGMLMEDNAERTPKSASQSIVLKIDTVDWPPGVHHLVVNLLGRSGKPIDYRNFAVKVTGPADRLDVTVQQSYYFAPGTHFGRFIKLSDGTLLSEDKRSIDGGRTWQGPTGGFGVGGQQLADGRVLGMDYRCLPVEGKEGHYTVEHFLSTDGGQNFVQTEAAVLVPEATAAMGHGPHVGPLFMRSIIERSDGSLVALMAGWFKSDKTPCPYGRGRPYSRTYVCESNADGRSWRYLTTIGYDRIGSEGYNEGSIRRLPGGELLAVMRTGSEKDPACHDNPIMWSTSSDEGRTWSEPHRTGVEGAYPSLAVLDDGLVVMSYGRPGAMIVFSADGGRTWADPNVIDATPYSGYTDVIQTAPGELLVGFGTRDYLDPKTGYRQDQLLLARVKYREK